MWERDWNAEYPTLREAIKQERKDTPPEPLFAGADVQRDGIEVSGYQTVDGDPCDGNGRVFPELP